MKSDMCTKLGMAGTMVLFAGAALAQVGSTGGMNSAQQNQAQNQAQMSSMMSSTDAGAASSQDKMFAKKALAGGMAEVQLGQLALTKSNSDDVKKFAQTMIDDHTKLGDQLKPIAAQIGVQPPAELMPKDKKVMTMLQGLTGDDFDKAYIKDMVKDHKEDNKEFMTEASSGQFPAEKDAATQGDQVIKGHLQMAEQLAQAHNVPVK